MCLYFLDLLQYEHFRREIVNSQCCKFIDDQAILQWQHYTRKRIRMLNAVNGNAGSQINSSTGSNLDGLVEAQQPQMSAQQPQTTPSNTVQNMQNGTIATGNSQQQTQIGQQGGQGQQQLNGNSSNSSIVPNQSNTGAPMMQKI